MHKRTNGFTVVELLIVIVVIAILAAISIVSYSSLRGDADNSRRISDMNNIVKALEVYRLKTGQYPDITTNAACSSSDWETSDRCPEQFLAVLKPYMGGKVPVEPSGSTYSYKYAYYGAGWNGCDVNRGGYYVLRITNRTTSGNIEGSPGFSCPGRDWSKDWDTVWVTGKFSN